MKRAPAVVEQRFEKQRLGGGAWNYTCGFCRTHFLGVADYREAADEWGKRHDAACTVRWLATPAKKRRPQ